MAQMFLPTGENKYWKKILYCWIYGYTQRDLIYSISLDLITESFTLTVKLWAKQLSPVKIEVFIYFNHPFYTSSYSYLG